MKNTFLIKKQNNPNYSMLIQYSNLFQYCPKMMTSNKKVRKKINVFISFNRFYIIRTN